MTGEETLSVEARLIADLGVQVARLTNQVKFREMIIRELKYEVKMERTDAVAFVRGARLDELADAIECGEHRREEKR